MRKKKTMMALSCSICQGNYDEDQRVPLILQCGHCFCKDCIGRIFSASATTTLSCPKCRHVSAVGNSVSALPKNFSLLGLLQSSSGNDFDDSDSDDEADDDGDGGGSGYKIDLGKHRVLKLVQKFSEGRRAGVEMWKAVLSGGCGGGGGHQVAVKRVKIGDGMDANSVMGELEKLRKASIWCRNVCTFHGALVMDGHLCLVMDKCISSVQLEMQRNEGRLTLQQILRFFFLRH